MVARNRLHLQETVQETPESSVASGTSTPTLDGRVTPAGTIFTDDNVSDTEFVIVRDTEDHLQPAMPGYQVGNSMARPSVDDSGGGVNKQSSAGQSESSSGLMLVRNMREYIMLGMLVLFVSFATMPLWNRWVGQGNVISLSISVRPGHGGNEAMPTHTTSIISTVTETIHVSTVETRYRTVTSTQVSTVTTTYVRILTRTVTATSTLTTVTATKPGTASSKPKPTNKAGSYSEATLRRWERGSSPTAQCYHGNAPTRYYSFLSRRKKLQRQEALWGCLDNNKNGIRWKGVNCGGARWEVEVDPNVGAVYSDSKKCWQRCEKCLSGAIKKVLEEAECVVEDRGSRCVARYTEL